MPPKQYQLEIITPLLLGGADARGKPELRSAPFRGALHYWLRAMLAQLNIEKLKAAEDNLLGSTQAGSPVRIEIRAAAPPLSYGFRELMLHHDGNTDDDRKARQKGLGFVERQRLELNLFPRSLLVDVPSEILQAFDLWLNLGGVGRRCRRGMGSLQLAKETPKDGTALCLTLEGILKLLGGELKRLDYTTGAKLPTVINGKLSPYPGFFPGSWMTLACREGFPSYSDALHDFWKYHLRHPDFADDEAFGHVKGGRRASPFHVHLTRSSENLYYLVLTAFNSTPPASDDSWGKTLKLFEDLWQKHNGVAFYAL